MNQPVNLMDAYKPGAVIVLLDDNANVFVAERSGTAGAWQFPQGGLDEGEEPLEGAIRELFEETAIEEKDITLLTQTPFWTWYDWPEENKPALDKRKPQYAQFKGARHIWFFFKFNGDKSEIDIAKAQDKEFAGHKWVKPEWIQSNTIEMRQDSYKQAFDYFFTKGVLGL